MKKKLLNLLLLAELWSGELPNKEIGRILGCGEDCVRRNGYRLGLPHRKDGVRGERHANWKGGRKIDKDGYILVRIAPQQYVREHRLVMEQFLGRKLLKTEVVHHVNENKQDNRIENLQVFSNNSNHLKETLKGKRPNWTLKGLKLMRQNGLRLAQYNKTRIASLTELERDVMRYRANALRDYKTGRFLSQNQTYQSSGQKL